MKKNKKLADAVKVLIERSDGTDLFAKSNEPFYLIINIDSITPFSTVEKHPRKNAKIYEV
jgi:hypothetical protein